MHPEYVSINKEDLQPNGVYFWHYKNPPEHMPYHCRSCKARVVNGELYDTFWGDYVGDRSPLRLDEILVLYKGDEKTMQPITKDQIPFYLPEDVVDMRHSNSTLEKIYVKAGANRNKEAMLDYFRGILREKRREIEYRVRDIERIAVTISRIDAGEINEPWYPQ